MSAFSTVPIASSCHLRSKHIPAERTGCSHWKPTGCAHWQPIDFAHWKALPSAPSGAMSVQQLSLASSTMRARQSLPFSLQRQLSLCMLGSPCLSLSTEAAVAMGARQSFVSAAAVVWCGIASGIGGEGVCWKQPPVQTQLLLRLRRQPPQSLAGTCQCSHRGGATGQ
eukprot:57598-Chlamydomonas_euryale.AAC.1